MGSTRSGVWTDGAAKAADLRGVTRQPQLARGAPRPLKTCQTTFSLQCCTVPHQFLGVCAAEEIEISDEIFEASESRWFDFSD
jgi:hypothetical protein